MASQQVTTGLAKILGIKLDERETADKLTRGESVFSVSSADNYVEEEPTVKEWFQSVTPSGHDLFNYVKGLFPFLHWIGHYNLQWLYGDLVAGITVGAVVVPQGMAYAKLAQLPVEYGLYSSFMGVLIYWFFATSKDITIGPVAVMSTVTGNVVLRAAEIAPQYEGHQVASALAVIVGAIVCFLGLARLGWLVDFISLTAISAFMTGSAINIAVGQVPGMMGITGFSTRESTYKVVINILKHLGRSDLNAAMGITALAMLYIIRGVCTYSAKRFPSKAKLFFFLSTLRTVFVILLYTMISWLVNRHHRSKKERKFTLLGDVPRGFQHAAVPVVNTSIIKAFVSDLPASVIVLLIEHISISKSFGRVNNYTIDPSQEMVAIGVSNLLGPFLGGYPATGSFSRTAIKSKAGVRTPFAGVITALVVLLAIYALPAVFFYIPSASLSGVIIHAVLDLITPPNTVYRFWRISPLEVPIFFAGVLVTVFSTIENGIYTTICTSAALLLFRLFKARGRFLGKVRVRSVEGEHLLGDEPKTRGIDDTLKRGNSNRDSEDSTREIFLPIDHHDGSNPDVRLQTPSPGIFIYRFSEGYNYPNANHYLDYMVETIFKQTRRTNPNTYGRLGDRPWNDPGPRRGKALDVDENKPTLKAIILDFSSVNNVDITSVQHLIDVRNQLDRYAAPETVEWHFAYINNRWTKRALAAAGFGFPTTDLQTGESYARWKPIFSVAELGGSDSAANAAAAEEEAEFRSTHHADEENGIHGERSSSSEDGARDSINKTTSRVFHGEQQKRVLVHGVNRPLFHIDLTSALISAVQNVERRRIYGQKSYGALEGSDITHSKDA
ncbi:putative sulfate permease protein [Neofusicoccum parvum UCRNP2]|uniref:Putative sulfate permease protein n=1 Tax=Botryosphaeria parva (strain UCR-NP2) TaxID=1287680 RepID=R1EME5_BOTPV|nr:putative sulfate permease protein [Neofusicoccum parvum UCRNP2]